MTPPAIHTPRPREEPSNADLLEVINRNHAATEKRLDTMEYHLVDSKRPERTIPIRLQKVEAFQRVIKWAGSTIAAGGLGGLGLYLWESLKSGRPH